nr:ARID DNA-binding domain-containing protein [Tanacetum cinerariifolium]
MLRRLRFKFATKILLHEINVHAPKMLELAKEFDNLDHREKLSIVVEVGGFGTTAFTSSMSIFNFPTKAPIFPSSLLNKNKQSSTKKLPHFDCGVSVVFLARFVDLCCFWIPSKGVYYAPEVTLNIISIDLLEKQGYEIKYDGNRCSLIYMFNNKESQKFDEDRMRTMHNQYLEEYFESLDASMDKDLIQIKGNLYSTKVNNFKEYVAFLNLIKQDEVVNQEWDIFTKKFNKVVKWFYNYYLERSLPGPIPPAINGVKIHLFDLHKLVEGLGGYLRACFRYLRILDGTQGESAYTDSKNRLHRRCQAWCGFATNDRF